MVLQKHFCFGIHASRVTLRRISWTLKAKIPLTIRSFSSTSGLHCIVSRSDVVIIPDDYQSWIRAKSWNKTLNSYLFVLLFFNRDEWNVRYELDLTGILFLSCLPLSSELVPSLFICRHSGSYLVNLLIQRIQSIHTKQRIQCPSQKQLGTLSHVQEIRTEQIIFLVFNFSSSSWIYSIFSTTYVR